MIHCLFIKVSHNSRGTPVRSYRTLITDEMTFGRSTECTIHLPDPRVAMHHAVIKQMGDGQSHLMAINGELEIDGAIQPAIVLTQGKQIMIGPYRLTVEPAPPDVNLSLSLVLAQRLPDDFQDLKSRTHEPLPGAPAFRRRLSIWMAAVIALIFLVLPLAQSVIPPLHKWMSDQPIGFDRVWSPGRFSNAHLHFSAQCANCHQASVKQVTDQACLSCHRDTTPHIAKPELQQHAFKGHGILLGDTRCAECHREHKAPLPLSKQDNGMCVKCHSNIKAVAANTKLPDIHDFDQDHPGFKLTLRTGPGAKDIKRVSQTDTAHLKEQSKLKFPHTQHVGAVQGPDGIWDVRELSCASCHHQEGKEMRFKPLSYKRDCALCHANQMDVGPVGATLRVPHGDEQNVFNTLKAQVPKQAEKHAATLKANGCAYCHEIAEPQQGDALPWRIAPLQINQDWFRNAHFNHAMHRTQECKSCHQVEKSETSAEIAMPDRNQCLRCHSGNSPKHKRIVSSCMSCHDFHIGQGRQGSHGLVPEPSALGVAEAESLRPLDKPVTQP